MKTIRYIVLISAVCGSGNICALKLKCPKGSSPKYSAIRNAHVCVKGSNKECLKDGKPTGTYYSLASARMWTTAVSGCCPRGGSIYKLYNSDSICITGSGECLKHGQPSGKFMTCNRNRSCLCCPKGQSPSCRQTSNLPECKCGA